MHFIHLGFGSDERGGVQHFTLSVFILFPSKLKF